MRITGVGWAWEESGVMGCLIGGRLGSSRTGCVYVVYGRFCLGGMGCLNESSNISKECCL